MKKSTLITTIAMIVVVVVALSTATYAWFTSATATTVQTTITTEAGSGWLLYGGSLTNTTVTYSSTTALNLTLMNGLYSPTTEVGTTLSGGGTTATLEDQQAFYTAKYEGANAVSEAGSEAKVPNFIRVVNGSSETKTLSVRIIIYMNSTSPEDGEYRAGAAFSTYIYSYIYGGAEGQAMNTTYEYGALGDKQASTEDHASGYYIATKDNNSPAEASLSTYAPAYSGAVNPEGAVASTGYDTIKTGGVTIGTTDLAEGTPYYTITFQVGSITGNSAVNLAFYAWLDGWRLDDTARNATVGVIYEFGVAGDFATLKNA